MKNMYRISCVVLLCFMMTFFSSNVFAAGFQLFNELSARGMGNGGTMSARTYTAESAWFNPAAIALMNHKEAIGGMAVVMPSLALQMGDHEYYMKKMGYMLPYVYIAYPLPKGFGLGVSANVPYGLTTEWKPGWPGRYYAIKTHLQCVFLTPSLSYSPYKWVSFGAGIQFVRADAEMTRAVTPLIPTLRTRLTGSDEAWGYVVSCIVRPNHVISFGITYRSGIKIVLNGLVKYNESVPGFYRSDAKVKLRLPPTVSIGFNIVPKKTWSIGLEYLWTGWSCYKALTFKYDKYPGTGVPGTYEATRDWHDTYALRISVDHNISKAIVLRTAYVYDKSPINDKYRDPSLPTNDRHLFSVGLGYSHGRLSIDGAYTFLRMEHSHPSPATPALYGTYKGYANIVDVDLRWRF